MATKRFAPHFLWSALGVSEHAFKSLVEVFHTTINQALDSKRGGADEPKDLLDQLLKDGELSDEILNSKGRVPKCIYRRSRFNRLPTMLHSLRTMQTSSNHNQTPREGSRIPRLRSQRNP
jgi:hypothetical protein